MFQYYLNFYQRKSDNATLKNRYIFANEREVHYRDVINKDSDLESIILFGCSCTYGHKIPVEKIPSYILGKYVKNPIYNRSYHGTGPQLMLYQLSQKEFYDLMPKPKLIIYTYTFDHINRIFRPCIPSISYYTDIFYKISKDGTSLKQIENNSFFKKPFIVSYAQARKEAFSKNEYQQALNILKLHFVQSKKQIENHWKDVKFVVFVYDNESRSTIQEIEKDLNSNDIIVIYRNDVAPFDDYDINYALTSEDSHPNENAWEYIIPKLLEKLKEY